MQYGFQVGVSRALSALRPGLDMTEVDKIVQVGLNPGHDYNLDVMKDMNIKRRYKFSKVLKDLTRNRNFGINIAKNLFPNKKDRIKTAKIKPHNLESNNVLLTKLATEPSGPQLAWIN